MDSASDQYYGLARRTRGFTLVELLIVILVIAILAAISVVAYNGVQSRAKNSALLAESSSIVKKLELFRTSNDTYPSSINACPNPGTDELCLTPTNSTLKYQRNAPGGSGYIIDNTPAYSLTLESDSHFIYTSNAERTGGNEFVQYVDLAPIIDKYGLKKYELSFDVKSANTSTHSLVAVYFQNGNNTRYGMPARNVSVTTDYKRHTIQFTPSVSNLSVTSAMLAFYGTYGGGNRPIVKNVQLSLAL